MLIAEQFTLIALDPETGQLMWSRRGQAGAQILAAALVLELAMLHRLQLQDALLHADATSPLSRPFLTDALRELAVRPLSVARAMGALERRMHPLSLKIPDGLYHRDILHRIEKRTWLLRRRVCFPLRSVQARNEALQWLRRAPNGDNDMHGLALQLLTEVSGMLPNYLDAHQHATTTQRLLVLNEAPTDDPVLRVFAAVRSTLMA